MESDTNLDLFLDFARKALGETGPLKGQPATMVTALAEAFKMLMKPQAELKPSQVQSFEDAIYSEPWSVYVIRNKVTGVAYVGMASKGFLTRYTRGEWWADRQHNERLRTDALVYGLASFQVAIYVGTDELDMKRLEAQLIAANRLYTYNEKPEAGNRVAK